MRAERRARDSAETLIAELEALQQCLGNLKAFAIGEDAKGTAFREDWVLAAKAQSWKQALEKLQDRFGSVSEHRVSRLLWPLNEKEHRSTIQDLRAFAQWINFSMSIDGFSLLSKTSDEMTKLLGSQLKELQTLQTLDQRTTEVQGTLKQESIRHEEDRQLRRQQEDHRHRNEMLSWLSSYW